MKLLVVKFSSIGDCVMAAHTATVFRESHPTSQLVWAIDPRCSAVVAGTNATSRAPLKSDHLVDEFFEIPWETWKMKRVSSLTRIRHYLKLREHKFDAAVDLQGHAKTAICLRLSGAKKRISCKALDPLAKLLNPVCSQDPNAHWVEEHLRALQQVVPDAFGELVPLMPDVAVPPDLDGLPLVTIAVGTGHPTKNYQRWKEVAESLVQSGALVAFIGGPNESAPQVEGTQDLVGKISLAETMGWIRASWVHAAADTGSGHIAAAYGVPVVSVFGKTRPEKCAPYTDKRTVLDASVTMDQLEPSRVVEAVQRWVP